MALSYSYHDLTIFFVTTLLTPEREKPPDSSSDHEDISHTQSGSNDQTPSHVR